MNQTRVLVIGAGGIVGQHMRLHQPPKVHAIYTRREGGFFYTPLNIRDVPDILTALNGMQPDVVVNLAGENRPDVVEKDPAAHKFLNVYLPAIIGEWCDEHDGFLIQGSTQGVYGGNDAPYFARDPVLFTEQPANEYGRQKLEGERILADRCHNWNIARLTFVLGTRPLKIGRANPFEAMLKQLSTSESQHQVCDRWFSPCFASDAARVLWSIVETHATRRVYNVGTPVRVSRYDLAKMLNVWGTSATYPTPQIHPVSHQAFPGLAPRPMDTSYTAGSLHYTELDPGIAEGIKEHNAMDEDRATELALFLGCGIDRAQQRLGAGFGYNHVAVAEDWRRADPKTEDEILAWYRDTTAYCWELSAYHADPGFNYSGMCRGIGEHLANAGVRRPLILGDGIGDMTISMIEHGMDPVYHDLAMSQTANFAGFRFRRRGVTPVMLLTDTFRPPRAVIQVDAVIAHDFFEHIPNVEEWVRAVYDILLPGGLFLAQNAFGIGDAEHGNSIPMHLSVNNKYADADETGAAGWDTLLAKVGFERCDSQSNWRRKPA